MSAIAEAISTKRLHLGAGKHPREGWTNLDQCQLPGIDVVADLEKCAIVPLPFEDDTFEEIFGNHVFEHVVNVLPMMQELHRITKPGGTCLFNTPYGSSDDADENPTHIRRMFIGSWAYFSQPLWWREDYNYRGDWDPERILLAVRKQMYNELSDPKDVFDDIMTKRNIVIEMSATLRCIKPIRPADQSLQKAAQVQFALV